MSDRPGPRARTRLRLQRLLTVAAATAAAAEACDPQGRRRSEPPPVMPQYPMPYATQPYQASDPIGPSGPQMHDLLDATARWASGSWNDRVELRLHPQVLPAEMRVVRVDGATVVESTVVDGELKVTLEPATADAGAWMFVYVEIKTVEGPRIAVVQLGMNGAKTDAIPCLVGD